MQGALPCHEDLHSITTVTTSRVRIRHRSQYQSTFYRIKSTGSRNIDCENCSPPAAAHETPPGWGITGTSSLILVVMPPNIIRELSLGCSNLFASLYITNKNENGCSLLRGYYCFMMNNEIAGSTSIFAVGSTCFTKFAELERNSRLEYSAGWVSMDSRYEVNYYIYSHNITRRGIRIKKMNWFIPNNSIVQMRSIYMPLIC